jgi:sulfhydrogenase subunit beta (sulfur reductase)
MHNTSAQPNQRDVLEVADFDQLFRALTSRGYEIFGPVARDGAIVYDRVTSTSDLPSGWTDEQNGGQYRLKRREDEALFGYAVGPHSWKKFLFPPVRRLWEAKREGNSFRILVDSPAPAKRAFLGVRACELHAIATQDKVFLGGSYIEPGYKTHRENLFVVAVNCSEAGGTCFCVSMNTGPQATFGYDLALTEVVSGGRHHFVMHAGTPLGAEVLREVRRRPATDGETREADEIVARTAQHMGRQMDTSGIKELLYRNYEHPRWQDVAARCLTCANCTMVCPTCFCATVEDVTDLSGEHAERWLKWDSCFTKDFSYIHGGSIRATTESRYRQWMTHKLATWIDQFGSSGCVGCGRCITWCPVAIDITEEVRAIREAEAASPRAPRVEQA